MAERELTHAEEEREEESAHKVYLRDGRRLVVRDHGTDQLVELRSESGLVELRIVLTEQGPVLQCEAVKLQLRASEAVEIASKHVAIKGSESVEVDGGTVKVEAQGENHVVGRPIHLNRDI